MKKIIALLAACAMFCAFLTACGGNSSPTISENAPDAAASASSEQETAAGETLPEALAADFQYSLRADGIVIERYTGTEETLVIPAEFDGVPVTSIGAYAFSGRTSLRRVTIPEGVTEIQQRAFAECVSLTDINIPDSVTRIALHAFLNTAIYKAAEQWTDGVLYLGGWLIEAEKSICGAYTVLSGTVGIADCAFEYCGSITSVTIPSSVKHIGNCAFFECDSLTCATLSEGVTSIGPGAFSECDRLESVTLPDNLARIEDEVFDDCSALNHVVLPDGLRSIGMNAFHGCTSLTDITIPVGVTSIEISAFSDCSALTSVTLPESLTCIDDYAFEGCTALADIAAPEKGIRIGCDVFSDTAFYHSAECWTDNVLYLGSWLIQAKKTIPGAFTIPSGTTAIADQAFSYCGRLTRVTIPSGVIYVGMQAFMGCDELIGASISEGVEGIGAGLFFGCSGLTSVTLPEDMTKVADGMFYDCGSLTEVVLPDSVTSIGAYAFHGCGSLTGINLPEGLTDIGHRAFYGCVGLRTVYFLGDAPTMGDEVFCCDNENWEAMRLPDVTLYYIDGKAGWMSPTWSGYPTAAWDNGGLVNGE